MPLFQSFTIKTLLTDSNPSEAFASTYNLPLFEHDGVILFFKFEHFVGFNSLITNYFHSKEMFHSCIHSNFKLFQTSQ